MNIQTKELELEANSFPSWNWNSQPNSIPSSNSYIQTQPYSNLSFLIFVSRHSDINLSDMDNTSNKAEDQTMLLEEGGQVAGAKPVCASFASQMLRFFTKYNFSVTCSMIV